MHLSKSAAKLWTNYAAYLRSSYKKSYFIYVVYWIPVISDRNRSWHVKSFFFLVFL